MRSGSRRSFAEGRYEVRTILPGKYPRGGEPAHLHVHLACAGVPEHWIPSCLFAGDPDLTAEELARNAGLGRISAVVGLREDGEGVLRGQRDVRLDRDLALEDHLVDGWYQGE